MSSENRSSSGVRNLRSIFENRESENALLSASPGQRGRSPHSISGNKENDRPLSKVRTSFVAVEPSGHMVTGMEGRQSSLSQRRGSFDVQDKDLVEALKKTVSNEHEERRGSVDIKEAIPENAIDPAPGLTPPVELRKEEASAKLEDLRLSREDKPAENPDKPVSAVEEEPGDMKPSDPVDEAAVSGGEALPPVTEDLRPNGTGGGTSEQTEPKTPAAASTDLPSAKKSPRKQTPAAGKPPAMTLKSSPKASSKVPKSPASQPKTPLSAKAPSVKTDSPKQSPQVAETAAPRDPTRKASRSSLTASTASSAAKTKSTGTTAKPAGQPTSKSSPPAKTRPRSPTRPVNLPSHLTAPTASSAAKREAGQPPAASTSISGSRKPATRPAPASAKPTPRTSLAAKGPEPRPSHKPASDGSFLERMMRPTAASASKVHDKPAEEKAAPRRTGSVLKKPTAKMNGHAKPSSRGKDKAPSTKAESRPQTAKSGGQAEIATQVPPQSSGSNGVEGSEDVEHRVEEAREAADGPNGTQIMEEAPKMNTPMHEGQSTPVPLTNGHGDGALEGTPAFGEDTIC